jgi:hypothetical protein
VSALYNGGRYNQFDGNNIDPASNGNHLNSRVFKENMDKNNENYKSESKNNGSVVNQVLERLDGMHLHSPQLAQRNRRTSKLGNTDQDLCKIASLQGQASSSSSPTGSPYKGFEGSFPRPGSPKSPTPSPSPTKSIRKPSPPSPEEVCSTNDNTGNGIGIVVEGGLGTRLDGDRWAQASPKAISSSSTNKPKVRCSSASAIRSGNGNLSTWVKLMSGKNDHKAMAIQGLCDDDDDDVCLDRFDLQQQAKKTILHM